MYLEYQPLPVLDFNGSVDIDGHTELGVNVSGVSTFAGAADFNGSVDIDGHTELDDLNVSGVTTTSGLLDINAGGRANTFIVEDLTDTRVVIAGTGGELEDNANLTFNGSTLFVGVNLDVTGDLDVDGHTNLDNVSVAGVTTFTGVIEASAGENKIPSLYANLAALPSASTYHGMFAHVHATGRGYFAHAGNWLELVNKNVAGNVGTGTEGYNVGIITATGIDLNGDLDVDGHTNLDNVSVAGVTTTGGLLNIDAGAQANTFKVEDLTDNRVVIAGTGGELEDDSNLTFNGTQLSVGVDLDVDGHTELDNVNVSGIITTASLNATGKLITTGIGISIANGAGNTAYIEGPSEIWIDPSPAGAGTTSGSVRIRGDLYVDGTEFIVDVDKIELGDFNIGIASTVSTNSLLDGAGLGIGATSIRKFITWNNATSALMSSENWNLASGKHYEINGTDVLTSDTLGSGIVNSSLTSVGALGALTVSGNVNVSGVSTFAGAADFNGNIDVDGHTELDNVNVSGVTTASGLLDINAGGQANTFKVEDLTDNRVVIAGTGGELEDDANLTFNGTQLSVGANLDVSGVSTFTGAADFNGNIDVDGHTELDNVNISGVSTFAGAADFNGSVDIDGHTELDNVNVSGVSTFAGAADFNGNIDVDGHTELDNVNISGVSTFTGAADFNGSIDVDGHTELDNVNVTGVSTFSAAVNATDIIKGYKYTAVPYGSTVTLAVTVTSKDSTHRYNGTGSGNAYAIDGIQAPFLTLTPGRTYRFTNDNTGSHPFRFYLEADKTTQYDTNVNFQNTYTEITVTDETPIVLHYQCTSHAYMGNAVQTNANVVNTNYPATIRSTLNVTGVSTFTGAADFNGNIDVDGHTELDNLNVSGITTTGGLLDINAGGQANTFKVEDLTDNRVVIAGTGGELEDDANLTFNGTQLSVGVNLDVDGLTELDITNISETLNVSGVSTFAGAADFNGSVDIDGHTELDNVNVSGVSTFAGAADFNGSVDIDGHTELDNVNVSGVSTFVGAADFNGSVDIDGHTELDNVNVSGVSTFAGAADFNGNIDVDGHTELDNLNVSGVTTASGLLDINAGGQANTFKVEDLTDNRVVIAGTGGELEDDANLTFNGTQLSVGVNLDVDGHTELDNVNVSGIITTASLNATGKLITTGIGISIANGAGNTAYIEGPSEIWIDPAPPGAGVAGGSVRIRGDLFVDGTTTSVNTGNVDFGSFVVGIASTVPTNVLLDGAGIGIGSIGIRKFIRYNNASDTLQSSIGFSVLDDGAFKTGTTTVLNKTTLGTTVVNSSLTSVGALGSLTVSGDISIADKIIHTGDTNTALRFPAADTVAVETAGTERLRIDSAGNVGVGTTNPSELLTVGADEGFKVPASGTIIAKRNFSIKTVYPILQLIDTDSNSDFQLQNANGVFGIRDTTNSADRFVIKSDGKVGIGTDNPLETLHVGTDSNDAIRFGNATFGYKLKANISSTDDFGFLIEDKDGNDLYKVISASGTNANLNTHSFYTADVERLRITSTGRIEQKSNNEDIDMDATASGQLKLDGNGYNAAFALNAQGLNIYNNSANRGIIFGTNETERLRIDSAGNVGVGITNPSTKLHLSSGGATQLTISNTSTSMSDGATMGTIDFSAGSSNTVNARVAGAVEGTSEAGGDLVFETRADGGSLAERLRIASAGQIGIGGANYGTAGQVLTSGGSSAAPSWQDASGGDGGSGKFDTGITTSIYVSVTGGIGTASVEANNDIFTGPGIAYTFPSTAGKSYIIESISVTNIYNTNLYFSSRHDFNGGQNTPTAQRVVIPYQGALEVLEEPIIAKPSDILRFQAFAGIGTLATGVNNGLDSFITYSEKTDANFIGIGTTVTTASGTELFTSTTNSSVIQSIRLCNYSLNMDTDASVSIYRGGTVGSIPTTGVRQGYLVYNLTVPKNSVIEILERPKYLPPNDTIVVGMDGESISATLSGKYIT